MDWKRIGKKLLFPPIWVMVLLTALCAAGLVIIFLKGLHETIGAYLFYVLSFYTLSVVCVFCITVLPRKNREIHEKIMSVPFINRYQTDRIFKTKVDLLLSFTANLFYVGVNTVSFFLYRSWWFVCLAVYYVILAVMRCLLVRYVRLNEIGVDRYAELKRARVCSIILLFINIFLSGAVLMILYQDRGFEYGGIMIYVMAIYTFYITTHALIDLIRYRKFDSPVMETAKVISLAAALVSMLNLETAMFSSFGEAMSKENQRLTIILTGAGVAIIVVAMSVYMTVRSTKEIKLIRSGANAAE